MRGKRHDVRTGSTARSSWTVRCLRILNTKSGARFPMISNVDFAYFSNSRICKRISPGMQAIKIEGGNIQYSHIANKSRQLTIENDSNPAQKHQ